MTVLAAVGPLPAAEVQEVAARIGERIDVVRWSHDPAELVAQLLLPGSAEVFALQSSAS